MNIQTKLIPTPTLRRSGQKIGGIKYIVCHDTGNDGSTAMGNVNYYIQSAGEQSASAHAFVDDLGVIWCIPEDEKAWHVRYNAGIAPNVQGSFANDFAFGIELCFGSAWMLSRNMLAYSNYVVLIASLCSKYGLNPLTDLYQHAQLDPTRRTDPLNAFKYINKTWDEFKNDVKSSMILPGIPANQPSSSMPVTPTTSQPTSSQDVCGVAPGDKKSIMDKIKALLGLL